MTSRSQRVNGENGLAGDVVEEFDHISHAIWLNLMHGIEFSLKIFSPLLLACRFLTFASSYTRLQP